MSDPKVFSPGGLTVAATVEALTVSCGHFDIGFIKSLSLTFDSETRSTKAIVEFYRSHHAETSRQIEESVRIARSLGWVEVRY
jgi:hypothetical protein